MVVFLLCETVREELGNKLSLLGLFTSNRILAPADTTTVLLPSLTLLFIVNGGEGSFRTSLTLFAPSGKALAEPTPRDVPLVPGTGRNLIFNFVPFSTDEFGEYHAILRMDGTEYSRRFSLVKDEARAGEAPSG
ncbi:DUF6941 family protein [Methyloceanibacter sp.]|uniref:DUF6941 family protein n=1 Tax=Methyloceanibacter sp. TaxID=1965321 RepID=UPI003D6C804F